MAVIGTMGAAGTRRYTHTAFFYEGVDELIPALARFVRDGVAADEHVLVVVDRVKGEMLVGHLGGAEGFDLADSADVYISPTRTLANYIDTVRDSTSDGRAMRVAGEPIWAGLDSVHVAEWTCVESACNLAFADSALTMLCPYDISILDPAIVVAARQTHPEFRFGDVALASEDFTDPHQFHSVIRHSVLPRPHGPFVECSVDSMADLAHVGWLIATFPEVHAVPAARISDLVSSVDYVIRTALKHDARALTVGLWLDGSHIVCDVIGPWKTTTPFAGFFAHPSERAGSPGLWCAGQRCDLIAIREQDGVTTVRLQISTVPESVNPTCAEFAEFAGVYALGACEPDEVVMIEAHLAECPTCRDENEKLAAVVAELNAERGATRPSSPEPDGRPPYT